MVSDKVANLVVLGWVSASSTKPTIIFPIIPPAINALTTCFRLIALMALVPIIILTLVDLLGWLTFKLILRPLGYTSTIRFKDPEPNTFLNFLSARDFRRFKRRKSHSIPEPILTTPKAPSRSNSLARSGKDNTIDSPIELVQPPTDESTTASDSSATSSPILSYSHLAADPSQPGTPAAPSARELAPAPLSSLGQPMPHMAEMCNSLGLLTPGEGARPGMGDRGGSTNSSSSSLASMQRQRAGSVGVDGPLVEVGEQGSDEEEVLEGEGFESDGGVDFKVGGIRRRKVTAREGLPKGGPAFGFTPTNK